MTRITEVKIKIESTIENLNAAGLPEGDAEKTSSYADGFYKVTEGESTLMYAEENEGGRSESEIICYDKGVLVKRRGAIECELRFEEGKSLSSIYAVPPYKFDTKVTAKRVRVNLDEDGGSIDLLYNMKIGGAEKSARMKIWILPCSNQT